MQQNDFGKSGVFPKMSESLPDHGTCSAMKTQMPGADINAEISLSAAEKLGWLCDVKNGVKILICPHSLWFGVYILAVSCPYLQVRVISYNC